MRVDLMKAHGEGLAEEVRLISEVEGTPKDAFDVFVCWLAYQAARGSFEALEACNSLKRYKDTFV